MVKINTKINFKKAIFLKKFKSLYKIYKFYIIRKQYYIPFCVINQIYLFKHATQKGKLSHSNITKSAKIMQTLKKA